MRAGLPTSVALHGALLGFALLSFQNATPKDDVVFVDAVDAVPITEESQLRAGKATAPDKPEPSPQDLAAAQKDSAGERAGTTKQELPPPPPAPKPKEIAALHAPEPPKPPEPRSEPKPEPAKAPEQPKPPEPKVERTPEPPKPPEPAKAPEPQPAPKPDKPVEADKAREAGEGSPPEAKQQPDKKAEPDKKPPPEKKPDPKDKAALDKIIASEAKKPAPQKPPEKKPEPAKAEAKPAETKTAAVTPNPGALAPKSSPAATAQKFDPAAIAKSIQSRETTGTAAGPEKKQATLGSPRAQATAAKMTLSEIDALKGQIQRCWNPPPGAAEANITVTIRFTLNPDGSLAGQPEVVRAPAHPLGVPLAASARRAVIQCAPYRLPAEKYAVWQDIQPTFDPKDL